MTRGDQHVTHSECMMGRVNKDVRTIQRRACVLHAWQNLDAMQQPHALLDKKDTNETTAGSGSEEEVYSEQAPEAGVPLEENRRGGNTPPTCVRLAGPTSQQQQHASEHAMRACISSCKDQSVSTGARKP
jgi:hypothetical protein